MRVAIYGYGNLGRGVELALRQNPDCEAVCVFSRRAPETVKTATGLPVYAASDVLKFKDQIDVLILCGGSAKDLPEMSPAFAKDFHIIDSFDNHSRVPEYFHSMDDAARKGRHVSIISTGWDPGIFSLERTLGGAFLPGSRAYGFYGLGPKGGLSMGHSDALRTIKGVKDARQFTHAIPEAIEKIRNPNFAKVLIENATCGYCASHQYEAAEYWYKGIAHHFTDDLIRRIQSGDRSNLGPYPEYTTYRDEHLFAKPLSEMRPKLPRTQANYVRVMTNLAEAAEIILRINVD